MAGERRANRGRPITYTEYDDDDFESPVKDPKKVVVDREEEESEQRPKNGGLLQFTKEGINNAREDLEAGAKKPSRAVKANELDDTDEEMVDNEDPIEDSDLDERENERPRLQKKQQDQRPGRAAAPKGTLSVSVGSSSDEEEESGEESSEEEEIAASSGESSEDEDMAEQEDSEDSDAKPAGKKKQIATAAPAGGSRRSVRATASAKIYKEDEIMEQYYSSEQEERKEKTSRRAVLKKSLVHNNEENNDPSSRRSTRPQRAAAAAANKKKASGYGTSDGEFFEDDSEDEELSGKEENSDNDGADGGGAIYISSGSDGEYGAANGGDGDGDEEDDLDEETLVTSVERILALRKEKNETELYVKITGWSFRRARWIPRSVLVAAGRAQLVRNFEKKAVDGFIDPYGDLVNGIHPSWLEVDRILAAKETSRLGQRYLVKWRGLGHSEATWERASALEESQADKDAVARYHKLAEAAAARIEDADTPQELRELNPKAVPEFLNGRSLRSYQLESLEWMAKHWCTGSNCILGDEMGLGKTAQSISVLAYQRQFGGEHGPFLVIAPLTTLGHWQREIETWTDMDCVVYAGSAADRAACQKYDLFVPGSSGGGRGGRGRLVKPNVVLSSYETVLRDASLFASIYWTTVIIDEAHRMKTVGSSTRTAIAELDMGWLLLLTGTPVQNNMRELYGLLNLVDNVAYRYEADFLKKFGDERTGMSPQQVRELQKALKPILLRRMKEDVETLPEKEECIIWTQLTLEQRAYYKAIFEKQIGTLLAGASQKNVPNLKNLAMELRKVCCHPFLCDGLEDDVAARRKAAGLDTDEISSLVQASGKMLLLHKLLPKLRSEGHKVLIFSQFKIMLDVLEDYMKAAQFPVERIDGSTSSRDRQAAIDRYSKEGSDGFVFLLSTRAGGQGITLTAADTCIIYDSDWNPQNDLQAMARCHRIGQEKDVTIYRLVSKDTYEEHVFKTSSRKYGLDEAILGGIATNGGSSGNGGNGDELDGKKIAELLKHGAHCLDKVDEANAETEAFASEDIDQILKGRTEKRQIGGRAGNTFSIATFEIEGGAAGSGAAGATANAADDKSFWATLLPEAAAAHETEKIAAKHGHIMLAPRQRKKVSYNDGSQRKGKRRSSSDDNDNDSDFALTEDGQDSDAAAAGSGGSGMKTNGPATKKQYNGAGDVGGGSTKSSGPKPWSIIDANKFFDQLLRFGFSENIGIPKAVNAAGLHAKGYLPEDFPAVAAALHAMLLGAPSVVPAKPCRVPSIQHETSRQIQLINEQIMKEMKDAAPDEKTEFYKRLANHIATQQKAKELALLEIERVKRVNAQWESVLSNAAASLATSFAVSLIPAHCMRAVQDIKLAERIMKFHDVYISHTKEIDLLSKWAHSGNQAPAFPHKYGTFPHWWTRSEDTKLLQGLFTLGWAPLRKQAESVDDVLQHRDFGFKEKMMLAPLELVMTSEPPKQNEGSTEAMMKDDSFQVRPSPAKNDDFKSKPAQAVPAAAPGAGASADGVITAAAPPLEMAKLGALPRLYTQSEWTKFRDTLSRHVKSMIQYLRKVEENNLKIAKTQATAADAGACSAAVGGAVAVAVGGAGFVPYKSGNAEAAAGPSDPPSSTEMSLLSTEILESQSSGGSILSSVAAAAAGGGGTSTDAAAAPAVKASGGGAKDLLKKVLQREAIKQLDSKDIGAAAGMAEAMEEDPIEPFSDDDEEDQQPRKTAAVARNKEKEEKPQKKKSKKSPSPDLPTTTAVKPTPLHGAKGGVATPGSGTVSALNIFQETRGDFTDGASGSGLKPPAGATGEKKAKGKSKGGERTGNQLSLLSMPRVMQYYTKGDAAALGDDGTAGAGQQQDEEAEIIDLASSD
ncbi:putative Chromodomain-helicase-DNA-binding protein 7 [Nannochloris sp. 'desiccata']|nr:putative Chromodomain-helicase-DNA-binding protein 7 [Chlorella desiccata (nom. nud.)]